MLVTRPGVFDPTTTSLDDMQKAAMMLFELWMEEDEPQTVTGVVMVEDMKDFSLSHITAMSVVSIKKMVTLFQVFCLTSSSIPQYL